MEDLGMDCKVDEDYSSTKQSNGKVTWIIDKGIWLGKKAVITGAVISSAPLVLPPLVLFSTLGLACSVPFGLVFATYACTQKIMSKLLPTPESSSMLDYDEDECEEEDDDLVQRVEEQGYEVEDGDLLQQTEERGYVEEDDDLVQRAEKQGYEEEEEEEVDLVQAGDEQGRDGLIEELMIEEGVKEDIKDTLAEVKERDISLKRADHWQGGVENLEQEKPIGTVGQGVTSIELHGRNYILPEGAALLQEDVLYGQNGIEKYNEEPLEQEILMLDMLEVVGMKNELDKNATDPVEIYNKKPMGGEEQQEEVGEGGARDAMDVNDSTELEVEDSFQSHVNDGKKGVEQEKLVLGVLKGIVMNNELDENAIDSVVFQKEKTRTEEEQSGELLKGSRRTTELNVRDTLQARADDGQKGVEKHSEEPLKQEKLMLDMLEVVGMKNELDENATDRVEIYNQKPMGEEEQQEEVWEGGATAAMNVNDSTKLEVEDSFPAHVNDGKKGVEQEKLVLDMLKGIVMNNELDENAIDSVAIHKEKPRTEEEQPGELLEGSRRTTELNVHDTLQARADDGQKGVEKHSEEPLKQEKLMLDLLQGVGMKIELDENATNSMEIHKEKPSAEEEQLKEVVEGGATMIVLNVNASSELEGGDTFQTCVYDVKNEVAVLKEEPDERMPMRNDMDGEARNETQGGGELQTDTDYERKSVEKHGEKPMEVMKHSHEGGYKEDIAKYSQGEDVLSVKGIERRNEKPIIEDMNKEPVLEMRQVIVSVYGGKKIAGEQDNEDVRECNQSEKLVLVAKKVTEETAGDMYINCNEELVGGTTGVLEKIRDEPNTGERREYINAPAKSFEVKFLSDKEKGDSSRASEISPNINRSFEETVEHEYVEPKNILSDLNSAREIADECGLDLFDYNDFDISQEDDYIRSKNMDDIADLPVLRVSTKVAESKHISLLPETDPVTPSSEELLNEEKIWEQIDALRAIVGYSAPTHSRTVEEIKALYIFIGVEPSPSFADGSDIVEVNEKLRLLKSVVGVK